MDDKGGKILARPTVGRWQGYLAEVGNLTDSLTEGDGVVPLAVGLVWERVSIFIERKVSTTHGAGEGSCRHAENSFLHEAGVVTRLVSPLSLLLFLHRHKSCSL